MPLLFYGTLDRQSHQGLYAPSLREIESSVFDDFMVSKLAPRSRLPYVAIFWHFIDRSHSALAWHDDRGIEQAVFIPSLLKQIPLLQVARNEFASVIPPCLVFRVSNEEDPYVYED